MILTEHHFALGSDEGVISVQGGQGIPWNNSTLIEVHEQGAFGDASEGTHLWVIAAHQWGPFDVLARVLDGPPADPDDTWEDVAEVSLTCAAGLYISELVSEGEGVTLDVAPGACRVRVSARGRAADWWDASRTRSRRSGVSDRLLSTT